MYTQTTRESLLSFYASGAIAGTISVMVSHPADTVKVKLQWSSEKLRASTIWKSIWRKSGIRGFFSGAAAPIFFRAPITAWLFTSHEMIKPRVECLGLNKDFTNFSCGAFAGLSLLPIIVPVELFKCKSQSSTSGTYSIRKDFLKTMKTQGPRGIYKGALPTFLREVPGSGLLFMSKDKLERIFRVDQEQSHSRLILKKILAGGMAGLIAWWGSIPLDTVKSIIQTSPKHRTIPEVTTELYRAGGITTLYKGLVPQCFRIFPGNASLLLTYEVFKNYLN